MIRGAVAKLNANTKFGIHCTKSFASIERNAFQSSSVRNLCSTKPLSSLAKQPVPKLDDTLKKYLRSVRPLLNDKSYTNTEAVVQEFGRPDGLAEQLHSKLLHRAENTENWLSEWWLKNAYLGYRASVVVNSSPGLYFPQRQFPSQCEWLSYATKIIYASLKYKEKIDLNQLPAEKAGKFDLDMGQYKKIFGTCRIPCREFDQIQYNPMSKHIVVAYRNTFYSVPVYVSGSCDIINEEAILGQLLDIVRNGAASEPSVGILTTEHRDTLAAAFERLRCDPINRMSVDAIQKSLFVVCLDKAVPNDECTDFNLGSHQLIHGGGSEQNSANRWYDKTLQFVVNENGTNGITYEHSPAEGQPIAVLTDFIFEHLKSNTPINQSSSNYPKPEKLTFKISKETEQDILAASKFVNSMANNLHMNVVDFGNYGKNFIKQYKLSPDSFIQMAMQYAFYKLHNEPAAHYETAQQRMFLHGRTETIRSCSIESVAFARAMDDANASDQEKLKLLKLAVEGHKQYTVMAMSGYGVDRHLLGLKLLALENNLDVPAIYKDDGFVKSTNFRLSTSQVASKNKAFMCYGPLVDDGYGICYNPRNDDMLFAVSSYRNCDKTCSNKMGNSLIAALDNMQSLLVRASNPTSKL